VDGGIFAGLKVIDCASFIAGPAAATVLSDFGAEVIKIEPPGGDPYRHLYNIPGNPTSERDYAWMLDSRNKKSLALDLGKAEGRAVLYRLTGDADVFITNFPPAVRKRLGITYAEIAPLNPRLVYASFTGYGEHGAEAAKPGFDSNAWWARSGMMDLVRPYTGAPPARSTPGMGDHPSAMSLYGAIVTALYRRERTGKGAHVGSSLMANGAWANGVMIQAGLCGATFHERPPREKALTAFSNHYLCRDNRWLILSLLSPERQWPVLAERIGRPDLIDDPLFATNAARRTNAHALIAILDDVFAAKDLAEWRAILDTPELVFGVVATMHEIAEDRQMCDNEVLVPFDGDSTLTVNSPFWIAEEQRVKPRAAPDVGQHSDEVLRAAGYAEGEIKSLRAAGVIR
jgi:formyl-CoA transferase